MPTNGLILHISPVLVGLPSSISICHYLHECWFSLFLSPSLSPSLFPSLARLVELGRHSSLQSYELEPCGKAGRIGVVV